MNQNFAIWLLVALSIVSANFPFATDRVFGVVVWRRAGQPASKPFLLRLLEWFVLYCIVGAIGFGFEDSLGNPFPQGWEFYVITLCLYLVMAYPGFVWRYLAKHKPAPTLKTSSR